MSHKDIQRGYRQLQREKGLEGLQKGYRRPSKGAPPEVAIPVMVIMRGYDPLALGVAEGTALPSV